MKFKTIEEAAVYYVDCINAKPNGWGQHWKGGRRSDAILLKIYKQYGEEAANTAISEAFRKSGRKGSKPCG